MDTLTTTVAGAGQFALSLDLETLIGDLPTNFDQTYLIYNVSYTNDGAAHDFDCHLFAIGSDATRRIGIIDTVKAGSTETGFDKAGCRIPIPRDATALWRVIFTTSGKVADGTFVISVGKASVEPAN